jgi:branched-chain amino acid transport system permease protein
VIAAVVLIGSSEFFRELSEYRMLIFGISMVAIMVWRPRGLIASRAPTVVLKERKDISGALVKEGVG